MIRRNVESLRRRIMLIRGPSQKRRSGAVPVHLNVYDLTPINGYAYWLGLGVYHSGVQVHGVEYAYGAHDHPTTGIFEGEPRQCPGFVFRKSILIGRTDLGPREVRALMEELAAKYTGDTYNLISKNCNHFCNEASLRLTGKPIPRWVNRLAKIVAFLSRRSSFPSQSTGSRSSRRPSSLSSTGEIPSSLKTSFPYCSSPRSQVVAVPPVPFFLCRHAVLCFLRTWRAACGRPATEQSVAPVVVAAAKEVGDPTDGRLFPSTMSRSP
ncbi:hypothetical protein MUK42_32317 [Musa troglodytarum]|uniref:PPPDE domain-containing protein n=1 Tax=Musa troglodytarum TaxID=320322 RepID=A0A9E7FRS6_9LILI|nr:hypothetical protein MUK42_32317 [Musa troglodytarum]